MRVVAHVSTNGSSVGAAAAASARPFWERPFDGGGPLRFGKDSLYHTRLVIIISAPRWIGRPKKTTRAGAAAFVVVVPRREGEVARPSAFAPSPPRDHATSPSTLSAEDPMLPLLSRGFACACVRGRTKLEKVRRRPAGRGLPLIGKVWFRPLQERDWFEIFRVPRSRGRGRPFSRGKSGRGPTHTHAHTYPPVHILVGGIDVDTAPREEELKVIRSCLFLARNSVDGDRGDGGWGGNGCNSYSNSYEVSHG